MIIVTGTFQLEDRSVEPDLVAAAKVVLSETRKEPGCQVYEFSRLIDAEDTFRIYEEWDSDAALAAHFETEHVKVFGAALGRLGVRGMEISKREAGPQKPLR
ncbi:MAG: putative quinol monooxygenase [Pseudomonadota bacterium]